MTVKYAKVVNMNAHLKDGKKPKIVLEGFRHMSYNTRTFDGKYLDKKLLCISVGVHKHQNHRNVPQKIDNFNSHVKNKIWMKNIRKGVTFMYVV